MTISQAIEKERNGKGQFVQTVEGGWKTKQPEYQKRYLTSHPWAKHWGYSKGRAKKNGLEHSMKVSDFKELWERDKAHLLIAPSIDRIDPKKGYIYENCRFIERSENCRRDKIGRTSTDKQRETARKNISNWAKSRKKNV